jgi:hypothetical protein
MLFNLHSAYVKAATPRPRAGAGVGAQVTRAEPPPGVVRRRIAVALAATARRLDGEAARRAVA